MNFNSERAIAKTRKPHWCHWCGNRIETGTPAVRIAGVWDSDFGQSYWHHDCDSVFKQLDWVARECNGVEASFDPGLFKRGTTEIR